MGTSKPQKPDTYSGLKHVGKNIHHPSHHVPGLSIKCHVEVYIPTFINPYISLYNGSRRELHKVIIYKTKMRHKRPCGDQINPL